MKRAETYLVPDAQHTTLTSLGCNCEPISWPTKLTFSRDAQIPTLEKCTYILILIIITIIIIICMCIYIYIYIYTYIHTHTHTHSYIYNYFKWPLLAFPYSKMVLITSLKISSCVQIYTDCSFCLILTSKA